MLFAWIRQADVAASAISCISLDLEQALKREGRLKEKVQELTRKLEKLREHEKSSEIRHQQSISFVSELKKANRYKLMGYCIWHEMSHNKPSWHNMHVDHLGILFSFAVFIEHQEEHPAFKKSASNPSRCRSLNQENLWCLLLVAFTVFFCSVTNSNTSHAVSFPLTLTLTFQNLINFSVVHNLSIPEPRVGPGL